MFQSTPPRGGEPLNGSMPQVRIRFNPRPRAGANMTSVKGCSYIYVSIHAPRAGANALNRSLNVFESMVSIHAPARGRTGSPIASLHCRFCFNPRPRAGANRRSRSIAQGLIVFQSTPPRGGELSMMPLHGLSAGFNPRPRAGANQPKWIQDEFLFQSTPPRGGELPRSQEWRARAVSIHAPARGRT